MKEENFKKTLQQFIDLILKESKSIKNAYISGDRITEWGSEEHVIDLEEQIAEISRRKLREPRGSIRRYEWSRVESRLKTELKSARKKLKILKEKDQK